MQDTEWLLYDVQKNHPLTFSYDRRRSATVRYNKLKAEGNIGICTYLELPCRTDGRTDGHTDGINV